VSQAWRLDYWFHSTCVFNVTTWVTSLKTAYLKSTLTLWIFTATLFARSDRQLWYSCTEQHICLLPMCPSSDAPVYSVTQWNATGLGTQEQINSNLKNSWLGEHRHHDDGRNLRYMAILPLQVHSDTFKNPQISCNSLFALLSEGQKLSCQPSRNLLQCSLYVGSVMRGKPECLVPPPPRNNTTHITQWHAPEFVLWFPFGIPEIILYLAFLYAVKIITDLQD